jgi:predicted  nucleic acid-binding Zn-ribbon protein
MNPEQRLKRVERILGLFAREGRRQRAQSREQNERLNVLIHMSESDREVRQAESREINEKINILINSQMDLKSTVTDLRSSVTDLTDAQSEARAIHDKEMAEIRKAHRIHDKEMAELRKSQSETDKSLRAFLDSLRKGGNGNSST